MRCFFSMGRGCLLFQDDEGATRNGEKDPTFGIGCPKKLRRKDLLTKVVVFF